jgi:hypothetical protein
MGNRNKTVRQNANRKIVGAIQEHLTGTVTIAKVKYTAAQLTKMFQEGIDIADATDTAAKAWHVAVATEQGNTQELSGVQNKLRTYVAGLFGEDSTEFASFGFAPKKTRTVSAATKAEAAEKRLATRKARSTMGSRQKLEVTGETAPASSAPVAAPVLTAPASQTSFMTPANGVATAAAKPS